jgi:hypothetical protein
VDPTGSGSVTLNETHLLIFLSLTCLSIPCVRGVKPVNDVTVKTVLKSFLGRVRKEGRWTGRAAPAPATRPQRAPVEDVTTQVYT